MNTIKFQKYILSKFFSSQREQLRFADMDRYVIISDAYIAMRIYKAECIINYNILKNTNSMIEWCNKYSISENINQEEILYFKDNIYKESIVIENDTKKVFINSKLYKLLDISKKDKCEFYQPIKNGIVHVFINGMYHSTLCPVIYKEIK